MIVRTACRTGELRPGAAVRAAFAELVPLFDGTLHHVNFELQ